MSYVTRTSMTVRAMFDAASSVTDSDKSLRGNSCDASQPNFPRLQAGLAAARRADGDDDGERREGAAAAAAARSCRQVSVARLALRRAREVSRRTGVREGMIETPWTPPRENARSRSSPPPSSQC